ncbi:unnamed protein product [Notodromas monacha]|uniref:Uncharacterized protein n=1 Tax=Notodromas monacha TaxID=399045 RepID=A0A7R9BYD5_9CRUS|nr:unnamed protein product [Notodromas monacha]CAG0922890.1 unnamed protein product [Notodromas monacha]
MSLIKTLIVNVGDNHDGLLYRLSKGDTLRLKKGSTLYGVPNAVITTNHPEEGVEFHRHQFRELEWTIPKDESGCGLIMADHFVDLPIRSSEFVEGSLFCAVMSLIKTLIVNVGDNHDGLLYRLSKGDTLRLKKGSTLYGVPNAVITTNHPEEGVEFHRHQFRELEWTIPKDESGCGLIMADHFVDLPIRSSGSFRFNVVVSGKTELTGDFVVDPRFTMGASGEPLSLDGIECVTVLPKSLGLLNEWEGRLRVLKETGYNMIHFTPVQELGASMSSYSLRNQHKLNHMFGSKHTMADLAKLIKKMETQWKARHYFL